MTKLNYEIACTIREKHKNGTSQTKLAMQYDVHFNTIYKIVNNMIYKDPKGRKKKLTLQQAIEIRNMWLNEKATLKYIGYKYNISPNTVHAIVNNKIHIDKVV